MPLRVALVAAVLFAGSAFAAKKTPPKTPPPVEEKKEVAPPPKVEPEPEPAPKKSAPVEEKKTAEQKSEPERKPLDADQKARANFMDVDRIGVSLDLFGEASRMSGEQWINQFRADESFDYSAGPLAASLYVMFHPWDHVRFGPGVRFLGNYGGGGNNGFTFGYLTELYIQGEYALRAFELVDFVIGGRFGASVLFPGEDFATEIRRLQDQGAAVWSLPRIGWVGGLNVGLRRKIAGNFYGRLDLGGQLGHQWLFATDQIVDGLRFRKYWSNDIRRLGVSLGVEVAF